MRTFLVVLAALLPLACRSFGGVRAELSAELIAMANADQAARQSALDSPTPEKDGELERLDAKHTERLKEIVARYGWPTISGVGAQASEAAWLLLQHSPDHDFMASTLDLLEHAAENGDVRADHVALLGDRVLINEGKPQRFGTQFQLVDGKLVAFPIDDRAHLDERRAKVGLDPIAKYVKDLGDLYHLPVIAPR